MATESEVVEFISALRDAYPRYKPENPVGMVALWVRKLNRYSAATLALTADAIVEKSTWFPALNEIIQEAGKVEAEHAVSYQVDPLLAMRQGYLDKFYADRIYNAGEWDDLARLFENQGRQFAGEYCIELSRRCRVILAQENQPIEAANVPNCEPIANELV